MKSPVLGEVWVVVMETGQFFSVASIPVAVCFTEDEANEVVRMVAGQQRGEQANPASRYAPMTPKPRVYKAPLMDIAAAQASSASDLVNEMTVQQAVRRAIDLDAFRKEEEP